MGLFGKIKRAASDVGSAVGGAVSDFPNYGSAANRRANAAQDAYRQKMRSEAACPDPPCVQTDYYVPINRQGIYRRRQ